MCVSAQSLSHVQLFAAPWTAAHWTSLSMGFPRQEYLRRLHFPFPGDLPNSGIKAMCPALVGGFFTADGSRLSSWSQITVASPSLTNIMKNFFLYQDHQPPHSYPTCNHHRPNVSISLPSGHTCGFDRWAPAWCCALRWRHFSVSAPALQSSYGGATAVNVSLQIRGLSLKYLLYHTNTKGGNRHTLK